MTRFEKRVAKMRKEYEAKVKARDERLAREKAQAEKARFVELQKLAKDAKVEDYEKMNAEELEQALKEVEK